MKTTIVGDFDVFLYLTSSNEMSLIYLALAGTHTLPQCASVCHISETKIDGMFRKFQLKSTVGPDGISQVIVRDCRGVFTKPLCHIFNTVSKS